MWFYISTILCFHVGAAIAYFSAQWLELSSSLCALPLIALAYYMVVCEERYTPVAGRHSGVIFLSVILRCCICGSAVSVLYYILYV